MCMQRPHSWPAANNNKQQQKKKKLQTHSKVFIYLHGYVCNRKENINATDWSEKNRMTVAESVKRRSQRQAGEERTLEGVAVRVECKRRRKN